mmetsp:Transcript_11158/g.14085  ORF Transcript_11158/g.14085 Transcript_11158/m.14085 type:complete len:359 (-) Transcript_11158:140-1216(-)|eukprot:CAMPEP_0203673504 /NCGR_PEP_ID=MMETSP0090-20130426/12771_1 /ASSEMBLY_ACC=CAM_ASM_001088 /TAXON_ID=426623 /ORGANISM="Chaetoceros affinis, Strain CCMP159" /LENGTH=358 /DNA_ID=CAMNT_0050539179 /DNA_START=57 /DNA_END=1133 /DNA_ORIENTATION=+
MNYEQQEAMTSIQKSLTLLTLGEEDKEVVEHVFRNEWAPVRDLITDRGSNLSLKLVCCMCSVGPPQSVVIAIGRAKSRIFAEVDEKGRHPLHYLCYYGAPTFAIVYAAQCHIAALEKKDTGKKTPLDYLFSMPWEYYKEDKEVVTLELQKCHSLKCYDAESKLPNEVALKRWGHKVVIEERIKCFMVCSIECISSKNGEVEGGCLSDIADEIREKCDNVLDEVGKNGNIVRLDPYRLGETKFAIVVKTQTKDDCEAVYKSLCQGSLGSLNHGDVSLGIGCVYCNESIGSHTLQELLKEASELEGKVKETLESAESTDIKDETGGQNRNVSPWTESKMSEFTGKDFYPDFAVSSGSLDA